MLEVPCCRSASSGAISSHEALLGQWVRAWMEKCFGVMLRAWVVARRVPEPAMLTRPRPVMMPGAVG